MPATFDEISWDESTRYFQSYFATVDTLNTAKHKMETLAQRATDPENFSKYAATALRISGDLELLKNKRRAFLSNKSSINPPSETVVANLVALSKKVGGLAATTAAVNNILKAVTDAVGKFNKIQTDA